MLQSIFTRRPDRMRPLTHLVDRKEKSITAKIKKKAGAFKYD